MAKKTLKKIIEGIKPNKNEQFMEIGIYFEADGIRTEGNRGHELNEAFESEFGKEYTKIRNKYEQKIGDLVCEYSDEIRSLLNRTEKFGHYTPQDKLQGDLLELLKFLKEMGFEKCDCDDCDDCDDDEDDEEYEEYEEDYDEEDED
jgi:hypothetical protein